MATFGHISRAVSTPLSRLIGVAEIAAAIGLTRGHVHSTHGHHHRGGSGDLMAGAASYHRRARDPLIAMAPVIMTTAAAAAVVVLRAKRRPRPHMLQLT